MRDGGIGAKMVGEAAQQAVELALLSDVAGIGSLNTQYRCTPCPE
jgi:hypothetical protein